MNDKTSSRPLGLQRNDPSAGPDTWPLVDAEKLSEFISVLGRAPARAWLGALRAELAAEVAHPASTAASDANIHHFCARAGLIGLEALHRACLDYLESRPARDESAAAYCRVRAEAERAFVEIDRTIAQLV